MGHPDYEVTAGTATFKGKDLLALEPEERSHLGLFLSFQTPIEVWGGGGRAKPLGGLEELQCFCVGEGGGGEVAPGALPQLPDTHRGEAWDGNRG